MASTDNQQSEIEALWREDDAQNRALYSGLVGEHGYSAQSLNWGSRENQLLRFQVLTEIGIPADASVLDVGCGIGDLLPFLRESGYEGRYMGLDITPAMVEVARGRFPDAAFAVANLVSASSEDFERFRSDFVVASGIFYTRERAADAFMRRMLAKLFALARAGVAFNSLSTWADQPPDAGEFRADPLETVRYARTLSPWVVLRHDYHPADFTIHMRHARVSPPWPKGRVAR